MESAAPAAPVHSQAPAPAPTPTPAPPRVPAASPAPASSAASPAASAASKRPTPKLAFFDFTTGGAPLLQVDPSTAGLPLPNPKKKADGSVSRSFRPVTTTIIATNFSKSTHDLSVSQRLFASLRKTSRTRFCGPHTLRRRLWIGRLKRQTTALAFCSMVPMAESGLWCKIRRTRVKMVTLAS